MSKDKDDENNNANDDVDGAEESWGVGGGSAASIDPILMDYLESHAAIRCGTRVRSIAISPSSGKIRLVMILSFCRFCFSTLATCNSLFNSLLNGPGRYWGQREAYCVFNKQHDRDVSRSFAEEK